MIHLNLEKSPIDKPRHLVTFQNYILAYGGDGGLVTAFNTATTTTSTEEPSFSVVQRYDDPVRAVAFSPDGLRVAVGFENGVVDIYSYPLSLYSSNVDIHPFLSALNSKNDGKNSDKQSDGMEEDEDDDPFGSGDDGLFSQSVPTSKLSSHAEHDITPYRLPKSFEAPVRSLTFDPRSSSSFGYFLAIGTESTSPGFFIANITNPASFATSSFITYLSNESSTSHNDSGVKLTSYSPNGHTLLSLGMDGRLCHWNTSSTHDFDINWELASRDSYKVIQSKPDVGEWNGADNGDLSMMLNWSTDGKMVGIPGCKDLIIRRKKVDGEDDEKESFEDDVFISAFGQVDGEIVALVFDPRNEGFVVTSGRDGKICLWKVLQAENTNDENGEFIREIMHSDSLCTHLIWKKMGDDDVLYLAFENGSMKQILGRSEIVIVPEEEKNDLDEIANMKTSSKVESHKGTKRLTKVSNDSSIQGDNDDSDDDAFNDDALGSSNHSVSDQELDHEENDDNNNGGNIFIADEAEEQNDDGDLDTVAYDPKNNTLIDTDITTEFHSNNDHDDTQSMDHESIDEGAGSKTYQDPYYNPTDKISGIVHRASLPEPQAAFAVSSTPIDEPRRLMCWNHIGTITSREDGPINIVNISFTDSTLHRPIMFRDTLNFILGSLGEEGGVFVTDIMDDDDADEDLDDDVRHALDGVHGMSDLTKSAVKRSTMRKRHGQDADTTRNTGSRVYFHRFNTFGASKDKDWYVSLPDGERAIGCATGEGWCAVITSRRFLRTFSCGGVQGPVVWLDGEPVTVVGRGRFLAVFYHESNPLVDGTQKIGYSIYDGTTAAKVSSGSVSAISSGSSLMWAGFTDDYALSVMDDDGMLSLLLAFTRDLIGERSPRWSWQWIPILDTMGLRKSAEDIFWPVSLQNGKLICVPLKGAQYPDPVRKPTTTSLQLRMPSANGDVEGRIGEISLRAKLALQQKRFVNHFMISTNLPVDADELENEYTNACKQADKVTLKLFNSVIASGKLERALDLVKRLHLEKSFDVAFQAAEMLNHPKLSDRILDLKETMYPNIPEEDEENFEDFAQNHSQTFDDSNSTAVSPDVSIHRSKRKLNEEMMYERQEFDDESVRHEHDATEFEQSLSNRVNPFLKKRKESPKKPNPFLSNQLSKTPVLSRKSTFSTQSRLLSKAEKQIM